MEATSNHTRAIFCWKRFESDFWKRKSVCLNTTNLYRSYWSVPDYSWRYKTRLFI